MFTDIYSEVLDAVNKPPTNLTESAKSLRQSSQAVETKPV